MHARRARDPSILLAFCPDVARPGNETADWFAADRPQLLTVGMAGYTKSGVIGRPSLGTAAKGVDVLASLVRSFEATYALKDDQQ
jgi:creatinine amidohydrolase